MSLTPEEVSLVERARQLGLDRQFAGPVAAWIRGESTAIGEQGEGFAGSSRIGGDPRKQVVRELASLVEEAEAESNA